MNTDEIDKLNKIITELQEKNKELEEHLKKYTAPTRNKSYYENHKEEIKQKIKEYREKTNYVVSPEKIKEKNKRAYLRRKEKAKLENNNETETISK
jgi:sugar-specific transcriptional regulator TrmB